MKNIFYILLLLPTIIFAQYPSNDGHKIRLGEQTTADGLVYRGLAADTTRKPSVDTMAYILLDTTTNLLWHYKKGTSNSWLQAGGGTAVTSITGGTGLTGGTITSTGTLAADTNFLVTRFDTSSMLTNYYRSGRALGTPTSGVLTNATGLPLTAGVTGTLPVANGGTGATSIGGDNRVVYASSSTSMATSPNLNIVFVGSSPYFSVITGALRMRNQAQLQFWNETNGYAWSAVVQGSTWQFQDFNGNNIMQMRGIGGNIGIGFSDTLSINEKFVVNGNARITGAYDNTDGNAANVYVTSTGVLKRSTASSIRYKKDVEDYTKGINEVMKMRPVTFKMINSNGEKIFPGFIAEELKDINLNELLQNNDEDEPDAVNYPYIVTLLTKAIQEQQQQLENLKKRLLTLENK